MRKKMPQSLTLISHHLCPYVQRAIIALKEKQIPFERIDIDLTKKPNWFLEMSPLGKTPILKVDDECIFESIVILEYLEETQANPLHPIAPLQRANNRSWIEFSSIILNNIAALYSAQSKVEFEKKLEILDTKFNHLEKQIVKTPYFNGEKFSLVDASFAPVFRYFDNLDEINEIDLWGNKPKTLLWREELSTRPSVKAAVSKNYAASLKSFLINKESYLSNLITSQK